MRIMGLLRPHLERMGRGLRSELGDQQLQRDADQHKRLRASFERDLTVLQRQTQADAGRQSRAQREFAGLVTRRIGSNEEHLQQLRALVDERFAELAEAELAEERAYGLMNPDDKPITQGAAKRIVQEGIQNSRREADSETRRRERRSTHKMMARLRSDADYERLRSPGSPRGRA
ncbi:MAG: hypothetical protein LBH64_03850 [Coriobacteriales bacterium]|nr:hypothetical protein [Coriobacteriales bacterium]